MSATEPTLGVIFFRELSGVEPVREWLKELSNQDRKAVGTKIMVVQYAWPVGMPLVRSLGKGVWEIRINLDNRIARILFAFANDSILLLNGFTKKTQRTPATELSTALERLKKYKEITS